MWKGKKTEVSVRFVYRTAADGKGNNNFWS